MKRLWLMFAALALPSFAWADTCLPETVAALIAGSGTTCSINGLEYQFTSYTGTGPFPASSSADVRPG